MGGGGNHPSTIPASMGENLPGDTGFFRRVEFFRRSSELSDTGERNSFNSNIQGLER